ncbi:hypothetical protein PIB30_000270 [Stylosanthes scabra]|uniref:UBC core domain-containing protein n=1 Tax=Stylosanthes scabra TaxID=79078 RepID=A0ABU6S2A1_9FABA|nr:hypothetical protein [Stylosanthes scabra]
MKGGEEQIFNVFDIVSEVPHDHFFRKPSKQATSHNALAKHIDLMRAVIIGAAGTPYHDGLFFFDIKLPSDYPNRPPNVHFHSFGYRMNPNLYNNGMVCLSLLNTWYGNPGQRWNPRASTLLQVLVSIQALVLNEQPYFNEPNAGSCETAFLQTWYIAITLVRRPPKNFEAFVIQHFRTRSVAVLDSCREHANGRLWDGYYCRNGGGGGGDGDGGSSSLSSSNVKVSRFEEDNIVVRICKVPQKSLN